MIRAQACAIGVRRWLPLAVAVPLAVTAAFLWADAIALSVDRLDGFSADKREDIVAFYTAGRLLAQGRADELYDLAAVVEEEERVLGRPAGMHGGLLYLNPPFVAAIFYPLSLLPYRVAQAVFVAIDIAAIGLAIVLLTPELRRLDRGWAVVFVLGVLVSLPAYVSLLYVQLSPLILLSWVASYRLLTAGRDGWGGLVLAASLIKPPLAVIPAVFLLVTGRRRAALAFAAAALALAVISVAIAGPEAAFRAYPSLALDSMDWRFEYGVDRPHMFGWTGFFSLIMDERLISQQRALAVAASLVTLAVAVYLWRRLRQRDDVGRLLLAVTATTVLVSPHIHTQDLLVFVLPAALLVTNVRGRFDVLVPVVITPLVGFALADFNLATPFFAAVMGYLALEESRAALSSRRLGLPAAEGPRT